MIEKPRGAMRERTRNPRESRLHARRFYERQGWVDRGEFAYGADGITVTCLRYEKPVRPTSSEEDLA